MRQSDNILPMREFQKVHTYTARVVGRLSRAVEGPPLGGSSLFPGRGAVHGQAGWDPRACSHCVSATKAPTLWGWGVNCHQPGPHRELPPPWPAPLPRVRREGRGAYCKSGPRVAGRGLSDGARLMLRNHRASLRALSTAHSAAPSSGHTARKGQHTHLQVTESFLAGDLTNYPGSLGKSTQEP